MQVDPLVLLTIVLMALVTYGSRAGGLWLMGRVSMTPRIEAWLRHIPGAVLVSLVVPTIVTDGAPGVAAALATALVARLTRNLLFAMVTGVVLVWLLRSALPH